MTRTGKRQEQLPEDKSVAPPFIFLRLHEARVSKNSKAQETARLELMDLGYDVRIIEREPAVSR